MIIASFWFGNIELHSRTSIQGLYREDTLGQWSEGVTSFALLGATFISRLVYIDL